MATRATTPTVNKLRLGAILRKARLAAGWSQEQLGLKVFPRANAKSAQSKLAGIEAGERGMNAFELAALQQALGITDPPLVAEMEFMHENSSQQGRWSGVRAMYSADFRKFVDLEEDSELVREVAVGMMPDLLMCRAYVERLFEGRADADQVNAYVEARLAREAILTDGRPRRFEFVLCESALRKAPRSDRAVVRKQLAHVIKLSRLPHIEVQVVPFVGPAASEDTLMLYPFVYLRVPIYDSEAQEFVNTGTHENRIWVDTASGVAPYSRRFASASAVAIKGEDARRFMEEIRREYR